MAYYSIIIIIIIYDRKYMKRYEGLSDSQLISSLILLVTGGVVSGVSTSKYEGVERCGGQQK